MYVLLVRVDVCGYGKASGNPIRMEAPGELAEKEKREREREQARPEYRMSGIFISRCHSWKVASFPWEKFFSVDATEWTCNAQRAKSKAPRLIVRNQMLRRNLDPAAENYLAMRIE